ncbi:tRNA lysidine(34) synthetase TilS [Demequina capsici]|uniref:tRNA(Ile)-lysidine synthase n=1 Tax=Demequina capsici TaxID=3075620 RepID=A0AA96FDW6_9MICO|nr:MULTISPECIES: tRNA lysidine(34) synthetase TilS [unclassified Demequina]WNM24920.1 tRNA lysidine(34) synthetase TilS [Demequina sp. OYTSA14]WNM27827.1 tRNA lysidine(34) synthetase TilS [Demequina sp. PMTSA13]
MSAPHPSVAACRSAVRQALDGMPIGTKVWVALSGGPDSLALAAATAYVGRKEGYLTGAIIVDHGLQAGSDRVAQHAAEQARLAGIYSVFVERVVVGRDGGLEAAARKARYDAINARVDTEGGHDPQILTGHTMDDQAETVLLALARGSGARALSGIPPRRGRIARPFLSVRRSDTVGACSAQGLTPWHDPTNTDPDGPRRSALRASVMPALVDVLGPGVVSGLARSAALLQADADELDRQARSAMQTSTSTVRADEWRCDMLAALPDAIRSRMLKMLAEAKGAGPLTTVHVNALDALVTQYKGQGAVSLPGGYEARREYGRLVISHPLERPAT